jgi:cation diffusion facilitator CzcD-associated flavoprotein CzcO
MNGSLKNKSAEDVSVIVIGAGFGGLTAAMMLRDEGVSNFRIIERSKGAGGTWYNNTYPGAEVDVPSSCYSWRDKPFLWSRTHAQQPEIQKYIEEVCTEEKLWDHMTLGVSVTGLVWQEDTKKWQVTLSNGEVLLVDFVISAVGLLSVPSYPDWPGYDDFKGVKLHTAAWDNSVDLTGKRVAVVGVGSSACQVVPTVAPIVDKLYVYQREPGWIMPKGDYNYSEEELGRMRTESRKDYLKRRKKDFDLINSPMIFGRVYKPYTSVAKNARAYCESYIAETFKDRPDLRELITPKYAFVGKRLVFSSEFYPALLRDNVTLIPHGVERLTETGVVDTAGNETPIDVLIMATGYIPLKTVTAMNIVGRDGLKLSDAWGDEPRALFGITVPKFPNFFMMYGPSTHGGMIFPNHHAQTLWMKRAIRAWRGGRRTFEVRPKALQLYVRWLDNEVSKTAWQEANSYVKNARGKVITQWPWDAYGYGIMTRMFGRISHRIR